MYTYDKELNEGGKVKRVSESHLPDAETFTDAEARLHTEMQSRGAFVIDSKEGASLRAFLG